MEHIFLTAPSQQTAPKSLPLAKAETLYADIPIMMSIPQMAKILMIGINAAYGLVNTGKIKAIHNGRTIRIPRAAVIDYLSAVLQ